MSERVEHGGFIAVASYADGEWLFVWRPTDPKWRLPVSEAETEHVSAPYYSQAMDEWLAAVDHHIDGQGAQHGSRGR